MAFQGILGAVIVIILIWMLATSNGFKKKEFKIEESLSGIEVALTKRYDMLTKLLDTAKGYMTHEKEMFTSVIKMRQGMSIDELSRASSEADALSGRLFAVAESYPELRSSEVFAELQRGIRDAEEHLQAARRAYNANVTAYNTAISVFPSSILAGGRQLREYFTSEEYKREDVQMRF